MSSKFEVVISGISGKFPDCYNIPQFRDKLYEGKSFMSLKNDRWPTNYRYMYTDETIPPATGKIPYTTEFDPVAFKISRATAACIDLNRVVYEPAFEAIMDAGINPYDLDGRNIASYSAYAQCDSDSNGSDAVGGGRLWVLGASKTMMSNRISFALNLQGPSFAFHNDLFGSFAALQEAYKMISEGYVEAAVVSVFNVALHSNLAMHFVKMNLLSMDAVTRVFDKAADGYGRSDSVVSLYIQRAEDAKRVYATIDFSGITYYGSNPNSFLTYDEEILKKSLRNLYSQSNYNNFDDISFMEMSASGLKKYDKTEANVIADIFCKNRKIPLFVGSVKSNVGNTEAAASFVALIKAIIMLESESIIPNVNLNQVDDDIRAFAENKLQVVTKPTNLPNNKVAVNSVGLTGSLSQIILRGNRKARIPGGSVKDNLPRLVLICGRTEEGTKRAIKKLGLRTPFNTDFISLMNDTFSTDMPFHTYRGYSILSPDPSFTNKNAVDIKGNRNRSIWFLFSGMGSQWNGMGKGLLEIPIFAETVKKCHDILKPKGIDIYHILTTDDPTIFDNIVHAFVGIITMQIALVEIVKALGIQPDGIIGHSVGENACAYADGCLTLEQAVLSSYARGIASTETETVKGMMAAIGKGYNQIKDSLPQNIEVACHNSSTSCTLSGPAEDVEKFVQQLQEQKVFAKAVNVANIAYHSKYIAPAAPNLLTRLREVIPIPVERSSKWVSTSIAESNWDTPLAKTCSAEYLTNNLLNHVLFEEGCKQIPPEALVIEIAPHGLLQAIVKRSLPDTCANVSLTRRNDDNKNVENLLTAIGNLYILGCDVNVNALYPPVIYPVPKDTPSVAPFAVWSRERQDGQLLAVSLSGSHNGDPITIRINEDSPYHYLKDHQVNDQIILPTSLFLYMTWWVFSIDKNTKLDSLPVVFEDVKLLKNTNISLHKPRSFVFYIQKGSGNFEILKRSKSNPNKTIQVMTGVIYQPENISTCQVHQNQLSKIKHVITGDEFYNVFTDAGYQLKDTFRTLQEMKYNETDCYGKIKWNGNWVSFLDSLLKFSLFSGMKSRSDLIYPQYIRRLEISPAHIFSLKKDDVLLCHNEIRTNITICGDLMISGLQYKNFSSPKNDNKKHNLEALRFVSHKNPRCQNVSEFLKLCLQIAIENVPIMIKNNNGILHVIENTHISKSLRQIVKECDKLKSKVWFCQSKDVLTNEPYRNVNCFLIMAENINDIGKYNLEYSFLLLAAQSNNPVDADIGKSFVEITKQSFSDKTLYLFKKKLMTDGPLPRVLTADENWTNNDNSKISAVHNEHETTFVIKKSINSSDLSFMFNDKKNPTDPRYVFIMDDIYPQDFTLKSYISQDLPVIVQQHGEWGSYRSLNEFSISENVGKSTNSLPIDIQLESINIQYFSTDNHSEQKENKFYEHGIEYSGVHHGGEKLMGLSVVNSFEPITEPDPQLKWTIPDHWSLEDAATVPFIYAQAYNILEIAISGQIFSESALINVGDQSLLAEACISILLHRKHTVYVTVANHQDAVTIRNKFPQINESQIFNQIIQNYEVELLKARKGVGVDIVINCLSDHHHLESSLNCLDSFGYCVHVANIDSPQMNSLGLWSFLKSISLITVPNKISTLLKLSTVDKQNLQKCVNDGIKTGVVIPFERNVQIQGIPTSINNIQQQKFVKTIFECLPHNGTSGGSNQKLQCDGNHSYILIGGEKKNGSWFELLEWLISKGARKFIIAIDEFSIGPKISHQINRLLNQKKITIVLTSSQKVTSVQDATQLLQDANRMAPLEAVFFVSMDSVGTQISNVDAASHQINLYFHLISIFSGGLKECEHRRCQGYPAVLIHGEKSSRKLSSILPLIEHVIQRFDNSNSPTLYRIINSGSNDNQIERSSVRHYLPHDITTLESIGSDVSDTLEFVEVATLSPRFAQVKDKTPIFVISALGPKPLKGLFSKLIYPVFCTVASNCNYSAAETAARLYDSLNHIQRKGNITLIAETWRSPVAIELSRLITRDGRKYRLFILEGNPLIWKERIRALGPLDVGQFENNLITQIFSINPKIRTEKTFNSSSYLPEKISQYLSTYNHTSVNVQNLTNAIECIRNSLILAFKYNYNKDELVQNTVSIVQRFAENEIMNFSVSSELFIYDENDYYTFLSSSKVTQKINDEVIYNMWYIKEKH